MKARRKSRCSLSPGETVATRAIMSGVEGRGEGVINSVVEQSPLTIALSPAIVVSEVAVANAGERGLVRGQEGPRSGYTLTEVLIATVLVVVLMAACWNLMSLYGSFLQAGRADVLERQLARSLFQVVQQDVKLVNVPTARVERPPALPNTVPNMAAIETVAGAIADFVPLSNEGDQPQFTADGTVRFEGTSKSLSITYLADPIEQPDTVESELDALRGGVDETSDRVGAEPRTVLYFFNAPAPLTPTDQTLPFGLHRIETSAFDLESARQQSITERADADGSPGQSGDQNRPAGSNPNDATAPPSAFDRRPARLPIARVSGLDRLTYDALFQPTDELTRALDEVSGPRFEPTHDHAPEVVRAEFEYFTGEQWVGNWNTRNRRSLPRMIRMTLWLVSSEELETVQSILDEQSLSEEEPETLPGIRPRRYQRTITLGSLGLPKSEPGDFEPDSFSFGGER